MYVELHLLGGFAGDKSQEAMQSHGWGNGRKVQEGCVSAVFVESGWDSWWFLGPEPSPVLGRAQESLLDPTGQTLRIPMVRASSKYSFGSCLGAEWPSLCHAWIGVAPAGEEVTPVLLCLFPPLTSLLRDSPPRLELGACSMELARWQVSHPSVGF